MDLAYHAAIWLHENLPALFALIGLLSAVVVSVRVARVRARAATLFSLSVQMPEQLNAAFDMEARRLQMWLPHIAYLDVAYPLCFALVGWRASVVLSRGFVDDLDDAQLRLVARHELLHVKHHDPMRGFAWHLVFASLILPAFGPLESWFANRRELRTNIEAAADDPERYTDLLRSRARGRRQMCVEAFSPTLSAGSLGKALILPMLVLLVLVALAVSHAWFLEHLAYLASHHC